MNAKRIYTWLTFLSIFLLAFGPNNKDIRYVQNVQEFRTHTKVHIQNVALLGMAIYKHFQKKYFQGVSQKLLHQMLLLHDKEKLASLEELQQLGYENKKTFDERLYAYYHTDKNELSLEQKQKFQALIDELNYFDGQFNLKFLKKHHLVTASGDVVPIAKKMLLVEKLSDLIERFKNPISPEEFDKVEMEDILSYFKVTNKTQSELIDYALNAYTEVVPQNPLVQAHLNTLSCPFLFK